MTMRLYLWMWKNFEKIVIMREIRYLAYQEMAFWYIETTVFSIDFFAMMQSIDALRGLRYKLRMMDIFISSPSYIYGANMSAVHNTSRPESACRKKSTSVCYHAVHESVSINEFLVGHITSKKNVLDLMKEAIYGQQQKCLDKILLYDVHDDH